MTVNKLCVLILVLITPFVSANSGCFDVSVSVDESNGGSQWDGVFSRVELPDIKVCFYDSWGERCKVKGSLNKYSNPFCSQKLSCNLGTIRFEDEKVYVEVIDVDLMYDDNIDTGWCMLEKECDLGDAKLVFEPTSCD